MCVVVQGEVITVRYCGCHSTLFKPSLTYSRAAACRRAASPGKPLEEKRTLVVMDWCDVLCESTWLLSAMMADNSIM